MTNTDAPYIQATPIYIVNDVDFLPEKIIKFCVGIHIGKPDTIKNGNLSMLSNVQIDNNILKHYMHVVRKTNISGVFIPVADSDKSSKLEIEYDTIYGQPIKPFAESFEELIIKLYLIRDWERTTSHMIINALPEHQYLRELYQNNLTFKRYVNELIDLLRVSPAWFIVPGNGWRKYQSNYDKNVTNTFIKRICETTPLHIMDYISSCSTIFPIIKEVPIRLLIREVVIPVTKSILTHPDIDKTIKNYYTHIANTYELY